ncbi:peroxisomal 2,4-dienoyl-CoA reductase [(3E)-enoyl-CoA-producing]-like, partial [Gigantopelta aegis]|uniref:peroxisomal 2,4-dienoyl-CoA reductase [(3E)-enoyl-CoA-producing]-like n=1 Tax=Gigantopelta aegis TaxID=1735272 RepID=UPI001B88AC44
NHGGVIINITATLHLRGTGFQAHAGPAKAAIEALSRHMAVEWGLNGVRVMCVAPGPIEDTEGYRKLGGNYITEDYIKAIPVQRVGTKADIGHICLYLVTGAAELLTGTTVIADGGIHLIDDNNYYKTSEIIKSGMFRKMASSKL